MIVSEFPRPVREIDPAPRSAFFRSASGGGIKWLKNIETGVMDDPMLRAWIEGPVPPQPNYDERPGRWVAEPVWPPSDNQTQSLFFTPAGMFSDRLGEGTFTISSPQTVGAAGGIWTPRGDEPDLPTDQRLEAGGSLVFDSAPLEEDLEILGAPELVLAVSSDRPQAFAAVVLSEVLPDGAATRVSYGLLNLSHRDSHEFPEALTPGQEYIVCIKLNDAGRRFGAGNRIRVAISTSYWPLVWPSPEKVMLTVNAAKSEFILPVRKPRDSDKDLRELSPPESAEASPSIVLSPIDSRWTFSRDVASGIQTFERLSNFGTSYFPSINWKFGNQVRRVYTIHPDDPASARFEVSFDWQFARDNLSLETKTKLSMRVSKDKLFITATLKAFEGRECVFERDWDEEVARDHV